MALSDGRFFVLDHVADKLVKVFTVKDKPCIAIEFIVARNWLAIYYRSSTAILNLRSYKMIRYIDAASAE